MFVLAPLERLALTSITASSAQVTNATTNVDCVSYPIPANDLEVGAVIKLTALLAFVHTAGATPTVTVALVVNGVEVLTAVAVPASVAATFGVKAEAIFTCRSIGASGTINSYVAVEMGGVTGASGGGAASQDNATTTVDTTVARTVVLRVRMSTAVASNSIRCNQAFGERIR